MEEVLTLLRENNQLLREIRDILNSMNCDDYDMKQFAINVVADLFADRLINPK